MNIFKRLFYSRDKPRIKNSLGTSIFGSFFSSSSSGKSVSQTSALSVTAVYSCVRILSEAIAGLPLHTYKYKGFNGKEKAVDHPLYLLLHDEPNPEMTSNATRETLMSHLLLWGNAYAQILRNGKGDVIALYPLSPNRMTVDRASNGRIYYTYPKRLCNSGETAGQSIQKTIYITWNPIAKKQYF